MLISAVQRRDEFQASQAGYPDKNDDFARRKLNFAWPVEGSIRNCKPIAEQIWQLAYTTPLALSTLYQKCSVCELKIFQVIDQLVKTELFRLVPQMRNNLRKNWLSNPTYA